MQGKNSTGGWSQVKAVDSSRMFINLNTTLSMYCITYYDIKNAPHSRKLVPMYIRLVTKTPSTPRSFETTVAAGKTGFAETLSACCS